MSGKDVDWKKIARDEEITKQLRRMGRHRIRGRKIPMNWFLPGKKVDDTVSSRLTRRWNSSFQERRRWNTGKYQTKLIIAVLDNKDVMGRRYAPLYIVTLSNTAFGCLVVRLLWG